MINPRTIDPGVTTAIASAIEVMANTALRYDPISRQQVGNITDILAIAIQLDGPDDTPWILYCCGDDDGLRIMTHCEEAVTTTLKGSPRALLSLLQQPSHMGNTGVEVSGSIHLLQLWQHVLHNLDVDWEEGISHILGDIIGPKIAHSIRRGLHWANEQKQECDRLLQEYLTEEIQALPSRVQIDTWLDNISELSLSADRLMARIARLEETLKQKEN